MRQIRRRKRLPAQYVLAQADAQVEPHPSSEVQAAAAAPGTTSVITCTSSAKGFSFVSMTLASSMTSSFLSRWGLAGPPQERHSRKRIGAGLPGQQARCAADDDQPLGTQLIGRTCRVSLDA